MALAALSARLNELSDSHRTTVQLIQRLARLSFQPGSVPLDGGEGDARAELSAEIHDALKQHEEELELLRQEADEAAGAAAGPAGARRRETEKARERQRLVAQIARLTEDLKSSRSQFRRAQIQAKRNAEAAKQKERELLFAGIQEGGDGSAGRTGQPRRGGRDRSNQTEEEVLVGAAGDVTAALRRTHQLMQVELERSQFARQTLEQSSAALADLGEGYGRLDTLLAASRGLVSSLLKSQKSDTWYLETAFYLLATTIVWLIFRRLLYGPLWWFLYLPLKLSWKVLVALSTALGITGGGGSARALSSSSQLVSSSTRPLLIVKPSATGGPPRMEGQRERPYIPAGAGGHGAKVDREGGGGGGAEESLSEKVGRMAEASREEGRGEGEGKGEMEGEGEEEEPVARRGDGKPLVSSDKPPNPKKRMWEEPPDESVKDEL